MKLRVSPVPEANTCKEQFGESIRNSIDLSQSLTFQKCEPIDCLYCLIQFKLGFVHHAKSILT